MQNDEKEQQRKNRAEMKLKKKNAKKSILQ